MKIVSSLLLLIGALAVLTLGAVGVSATPAMADAPCHEMSSTVSDQTPDHSGKGSGQDSDKTPGKPMKAMACCVACVAAPTLDPASDPGPTVVPARLSAPLFDVPAGLLLSPEPGPPRLLIA